MSEKKYRLSVQLYESCVNPATHGICTIDEYPSGYIEVSTYRGKNTSEELNTSTFSLPPTEQGIAEAESIAYSLNAWASKTRKLLGMQEVIKEIPIEFT